MVRQNKQAETCYLCLTLSTSRKPGEISFLKKICPRCLMDDVNLVLMVNTYELTTDTRDRLSRL